MSSKFGLRKISRATPLAGFSKPCLWQLRDLDDGPTHSSGRTDPRLQTPRTAGQRRLWRSLESRAPGGLLKAIKLINGSLRCSHGGEAQVQQELKSLDRVKQVRHPYVLSLDRFDIVDGQLFIVMELADHSVWDRFSDCTREGLPGIPREELLRYLEEAAEALDVMSIQFGLQHADIKPQNLFLIHNHIKVADFGLVRDLENAKVLESGCFSPMYGAPETFEGRISAKSDQYSLAIVYQELLTGVRPFDGKTPRQLLMQHMTCQPNVSSLPPGEQAVIRRALAKKPEERFDSCGDLVKALFAAGLPKKAVETHTKMKRPGLSAAGVLPKPSATGPSARNRPPP